VVYIILEFKALLPPHVCDLFLRSVTSIGQEVKILSHNVNKNYSLYLINDLNCFHPKTRPSLKSRTSALRGEVTCGYQTDV